MSDLDPDKEMIAEMFVALVHAETVLSHAPHLTTGGDCTGLATNTGLALGKVRSAIAKAEGDIRPMTNIMAFKDWLVARNGELLPPENRFQKIRVQMPGHDEPLVMYVTARDKQEWSPALLELYTEFEQSQKPITGYPSSRDRYRGK